MRENLVIDTTALISYFSNVFEKESQISNQSLDIINAAFIYDYIKLSIPSIVFVEIYNKWFKNEEMAANITLLSRLKEKRILIPA